MTVPNKTYNLTVLSDTLICGFYFTGGSSTEYQPQFSVNDISLEAGLDQMVRGECQYGMGYSGRNITPDLDHCDLNWGILPNHPHSYSMIEIAAGESSSGTLYLRGYQAAVGDWLNAKQDALIANGLYMNITNLDPVAPDENGEYVYYAGLIWSVKIFFLNPIVNSISRLWAPTAGGVAVILTGLGFNNSDSELNTGGPTKSGGWTDRVDEIDFVGLQGQGITTITVAAGDFTVDSNSQITIPANKFPALSAGSYDINLKKINVNLDVLTDITGYAGDWACDENGRVYVSSRMNFYVSDVYVAREFRERKAPLILTDWHLKAKSDGSEVMKYYSMDHIRCPDRVYKPSLSAISSIPRGIDSKTGLFKITDLTLNLANNDLEFSKLLAGTTILKNQLIKFYQAYPDEPFGWRSHIITTIIDDYDLQGEIFKVKLKDITQKYFRRNIPHDVCSADYEDFDYSNIHPDSKGAPVPEILGLCSLTTGEFRGQIEAICIDTVNFIYLAAKRALSSIDQVYSDDIVAVDTANYSVSIEDDGRTYITFTGDQGDKKVTFNCKGYIYGGLNSTNNYVQNPAYIALYFLLVILEIPPTLIDFQSFDDLADIFTAMGEDTAGKLILQDQENPLDILEKLIPGYSCFPAKDGRIMVGKKDISNYATNNSVAAPVIFSQIDMIGGLKRKFNLRSAINLINADFDYVPTWDLFKSNASGQSDITIDPWDPVIVEDDRRTTIVRRIGARKIRSWAR
ncbi:MAG: hypothetical protein KAT69_03205 [Candidatus Aminicenantes bacterium]|nr:hypothetical protein [Candidatus Aminicenantes bacterium]